MDENLISRIYECAFAPELWPLTLAEIADLAEARGSILLTVNTDYQVMEFTNQGQLPRTWGVKGKAGADAEGCAD